MVTVGIGTAIVLDMKILNSFQSIPTTEDWTKGPKSESERENCQIARDNRMGL